MPALRKVVAHARGGQVLKGFMITASEGELSTLANSMTITLPPELPIHLVDSDVTLSVPLVGLKALFFVKTFEGPNRTDEVKSFQMAPNLDGVWVRLKFYDDETTEGVIRNTHDFIHEPGFFLNPPDPLSNNELMYVVKNSVSEFLILGARHSGVCRTNFSMDKFSSNGGFLVE
ncbi:MAG: DUF6982 domain-containing protein [Terriglobia bacterium]